jgi:hypothetical protein
MRTEHFKGGRKGGEKYEEKNENKIYPSSHNILFRNDGI